MRGNWPIYSMYSQYRYNKLISKRPYSRGGGQVNFNPYKKKRGGGGSFNHPERGGGAQHVLGEF